MVAQYPVPTPHPTNPDQHPATSRPEPPEKRSACPENIYSKKEKNKANGNASRPRPARHKQGHSAEGVTQKRPAKKVL